MKNHSVLSNSTSLTKSASLSLLLTLSSSQMTQAEEEVIQAGTYEQLCTCVEEETGLRQIPVTIRDFPDSHIDFQNKNIIDFNIVTDTLGADGRPVYKPGNNGSTPSTHGKVYFDQWYRDVPGVNISFHRQLEMQPSDDSRFKYTFNDAFFFPIDGEGFGNYPGATGHDGNPHNFHFTLETHLKFFYVPGGTFRFRGDDDLWIYINGKLVVNLGGVHGPETRTVELDSIADELGLEPGNSYPFDLFFAERHARGSVFQFESSFELQCL